MNLEHQTSAFLDDVIVSEKKQEDKQVFEIDQPDLLADSTTINPFNSANTTLAKQESASTP